MHKQLTVSIFILVSILATEVSAAAKKYNISGRLTGAAGYSIMLVQKNGATKTTALASSGAFSFKKLTLAQIKGASLQMIDADGRYAGPIVLASKSSKGSIAFSGKAKNSSSFVLGKFALKSNYAALKKGQLHKVVYSTPQVILVNGKPVGAGEMGLAETASSSARRVAANSIVINADATPSPGADSDDDGIPDAFDADDDGDLVLDSSDPDSSGADVPMTSINADFRRTLNSQVREGLSDELIDAIVGGENIFALTFFISLAENQSSVDGGHVICDDELVYCRKDTPLAYYGGISESSSEFRDRPWSELLTAAGYPKMELISISGRPALVASIQPRVGRDQFRPGDVYQLRITEGTSTQSTRSLALAPYFVSVPAIKEYNAGSGVVTVDYEAVTENSGSIPGITGNPIVLSSDGNLTITFWRPQRQAIRSDEAGYYDLGNLNYGLVIDQAQATCAGFYSTISTDLTEDPDGLGSGGSALAQNGANISPLKDSQADRAASAENTLSFTVNLKDCLARASLSAGTYNVSLRAAGEDVTGGQSTAVQSISVQIP